eukprot:CAMPEP_0170646782 /NCGR_PEP_ID=MMETSP0224-20130122/43825_1 /TAXON_ID=285029 /ORGANISM="Togula jolla, Strain CCCM 725" /LENGTH=220 /DNA_ID=CAMNT_0010978145 /DNA_START=13 /DNA_END=672 /DNA_ORIENTATION=-
MASPNDLDMAALKEALRENPAENSSDRLLQMQILKRELASETTGSPPSGPPKDSSCVRVQDGPEGSQGKTSYPPGQWNISTQAWVKARGVEVGTEAMPKGQGALKEEAQGDTPSDALRLNRRKQRSTVFSSADLENPSGKAINLQDSANAPKRGAGGAQDQRGRLHLDQAESPNSSEVLRGAEKPGAPRPISLDAPVGPPGENDLNDSRGRSRRGRGRRL